MTAEEIKAKSNSVANLYYKLATMKPSDDFTLEDIRTTAQYLMEYLIIINQNAEKGVNL